MEHSTLFQLSAADAEFYQENGYLVVENLLSRDEVEQLKTEQLNICKGKTEKPIKGVLPPDQLSNLTDEQLLSVYLAIHFPHKISKIIYDLLVQPKTVEVLKQLLGPNVKAVQSMMFMKGPGKRGQAYHQDEYYIPTRDCSLTATWIALDDATISNGCLWVIPKSHKHGVIYQHSPHNDERYDASVEAHSFPFEKDNDCIPVELKAGGAVFFNGYLLHKSLPNITKNKFRRAFANHYMRCESVFHFHCRIFELVFLMCDNELTIV